MIATEKVRGVGPVLRLALAECGFRTADDLANARLVELQKVPGIGPASARKLIAAAKTAIAEEEPDYPADNAETRFHATSSPPSFAEDPRVETVADDTSGTATTGAKDQKKKKKKKKKAKAARKAAKLQAKAAKVAAKQKAKAAKKAAKLAAKAAKKAAKLNAEWMEDGKAARKAEMKSKRKKQKERKKGTG